MGVFEIGVRVMRPEVGQPVYAGYPDGLVVVDAQLGHAYAKNFKGFFPGERYGNIPIEINSFGFRDVEWSAKPPPESDRVIVLGDSITFGSPLQREDRFSEQAANALGERTRKVNILNLGVNGYNVEQYERLLRSEGSALKPAVVLIGLCLNDADALDPVDTRRMQISQGVIQGKTWARLRRVAAKHHFDLGQSYAYKLIRRTIMIGLWQSPKFVKFMTDRYTRTTQEQLADLYTRGAGLSRLRHNLETMQQFARESLGAELAVLVFAYHSQLKNKDPSLLKKVDALLNELNIPFVDLYDVFLPHLGTEDLYAYRDDCHPGPPGHRLVGLAAAKMIASLLDRNADQDTVTDGL